MVDDASPDGTGGIADSLSAADGRIHVLHRQGKAGLGRAYLAGFDWALRRDYQIIQEMDADFSHDPKYLPAMFTALLQADVAVGSRYIKGGSTQGWGILRRLISQGGGIYARAVLGMSIRDLTAGFVAYRRSALEALDLAAVTSEGYVFQIEMKYRAWRQGLRLTEVPIVFSDRVAGESKMTPKIAREAITRVILLRMRVP